MVNPSIPGMAGALKQDVFWLLDSRFGIFGRSDLELGPFNEFCLIWIFLLAPPTESLLRNLHSVTIIWVDDKI